MGFSRQEYWGGLSCPPSGHLPNPWVEPRSPTLQADSLPSEDSLPPGKPKNTGVGSLSLLLCIFLTQGLNWDLLHCRKILYQLPGKPMHINIHIHLEGNTYTKMFLVLTYIRLQWFLFWFCFFGFSFNVYCIFFLNKILCVEAVLCWKLWFNVISIHGVTDGDEVRVAAWEFGPSACVFPHFVCLV